jgi:hypothetical protein
VWAGVCEGQGIGRACGPSPMIERRVLAAPQPLVLHLAAAPPPLPTHIIKPQAEVPSQDDLRLAGVGGFMPYKAAAELIKHSMVG